jgi:hypothetical protein
MVDGGKGKEFPNHCSVDIGRNSATHGNKWKND